MIKEDTQRLLWILGLTIVMLMIFENGGIYTILILYVMYMSAYFQKKGWWL